MTEQQIVDELKTLAKREHELCEQLDDRMRAVIKRVSLANMSISRHRYFPGERDPITWSLTYDHGWATADGSVNGQGVCVRVEWSDQVDGDQNYTFPLVLVDEAELQKYEESCREAVAVAAEREAQLKRDADLKKLAELRSLYPEVS